MIRVERGPNLQIPKAVERNAPQNVLPRGLRGHFMLYFNHKVSQTDNLCFREHTLRDLT